MRTLETLPPFASLLRHERLSRAWSQARLAQELGNIDVKTISRWERGITKPTAVLRERLCSLFGKPASQLGLVEQEDLSSLPAPFPHTPLYDPAIPPPPPTRLVGREQSLASIKTRLLDGGNVTVTALNGLPGVGKTALAVVLAHDQEVRMRFPDGILWAGLGPAPHLASLWSRWGTQLGMTPTQIATLNQEDWPHALHAAIGMRHMLLVIDDVWHLDDAFSVKIGGSHCAYLITTRFPTIAAHMTPEGALPLQELNEEESVALLRLLAPQVVDREGHRVHDLVQAVGGLPLALILLGNYLRGQAYVGPTRRIITALAHLSEASVRLQIGEPTAPIESHPGSSAHTPLSLQSAISISDQHLDKQARTALYALSVFPPKPHTFSEEAALIVANCPIEALDRLADAGLLESTGADRYTLHQVIADYARLRLQDTEAYLRLIHYAITYVEQHKKRYELLDQESALIQAAFSSAQALEKKAEFVRGVHASVPFLLARGLYIQAEAYLLKAFEWGQNERSFVETLLALGELKKKQTEFVKAEEYLQQGLQLASTISDPWYICSALASLGAIAVKRGVFMHAQSLLKEGLVLATRYHYDEVTCVILKELGTVADELSEPSQAESYYQEGLVLARQLGDREQLCLFLLNYAVFLGKTGKWEEALEIDMEALALARQMGHREWECVLLCNLATLCTLRSEPEEAEAYSLEGLALARQLRHREWMSLHLLTLGMDILPYKDPRRAEEALREGLALATEIDRPYLRYHALKALGDLCLAQHRLEEAQSYFQHLTLAPFKNMQISANVGLAKIAALQGRLQQAREIGQASLEEARRLDGEHKLIAEIEAWLHSLPRY